MRSIPVAFQSAILALWFFGQPDSVSRRLIFEKSLTFFRRFGFRFFALGAIR
jgi:hypothetical protein